MRAQYYRWLDEPVGDTDLDEAWLANAIVDAHRDDPEFGDRFLAGEVHQAGFDVSDRVVWRIRRHNGLVVPVRQAQAVQGHEARDTGP